MALQNFLFTTKDEDAPMKVIDFGLSDFIRPGNGSTTLNYLSASFFLGDIFLLEGVRGTLLGWRLYLSVA